LPFIDDVHQILNDPDGDVRQTLKNLKEFSFEIRNTQQRLDDVLKKVDANLNEQVEPLLLSLSKSAANAEMLSEKLDNKLPDLLEKADSSMDSLRAASETINQAVQKTAPQIPVIVSEVHGTMSKADLLIGDTQEMVDTLSTHWPLNSNVAKPEATPIKMDSHD